MFNYSQERVPHKLLMEISRNEEVPKLVTAHQLSRSKDVRNKLLMQARSQTHAQQYQNSAGTQRKVASRTQETVKMQHQLQNQRSENDELRSIIKQMKKEVQKLREVNEGLIVRLKQVQSSYRLLRSDLQKSNQQQQHKLKINIYADIEEYIKIVVERLTLNLKQEKMTMALENKLQRFLAELLQINAVTVEQFMKMSRLEPSRINQVNNFQSQSRATGTLKYTNNFKPNREQLPSQEHYASIMQRLTGQPKMSMSYAGTGHGFASAVSQDSKFKTIYATTPQKRKRIFQ